MNASNFPSIGSLLTKATMKKGKAVTNRDHHYKNNHYNLGSFHIEEEEQEQQQSLQDTIEEKNAEVEHQDSKCEGLLIVDENVKIDTTSVEEMASNRPENVDLFPSRSNFKHTFAQRLDDLDILQPTRKVKPESQRRVYTLMTPNSVALQQKEQNPSVSVGSTLLLAGILALFTKSGSVIASKVLNKITLFQSKAYLSPYGIPLNLGENSSSGPSEDYSSDSKNIRKRRWTIKKIILAVLLFWIYSPFLGFLSEIFKAFCEFFLNVFWMFCELLAKICIFSFYFIFGPIFYLIEIIKFIKYFFEIFK